MFLIFSLLHFFLFKNDGLRAEQSFCFLLGFLISLKKEQFNRMTYRQITPIMSCLFIIGSSALILKHVIPYFEPYYIVNFLQCLIKLSFATFLFFTISVAPKYISANKKLIWLGSMSLELYLVHIPILGFVHRFVDIIPFIVWSLGFSYSFFLFNRKCYYDWLFRFENFISSKHSL